MKWYNYLWGLLCLWLLAHRIMECCSCSAAQWKETCHWQVSDTLESNHFGQQDNTPSHVDPHHHQQAKPVCGVYQSEIFSVSLGDSIDMLKTPSDRPDQLHPATMQIQTAGSWCSAHKLDRRIQMSESQASCTVPPHSTATASEQLILVDCCHQTSAALSLVHYATLKPDQQTHHWHT